MESGIGNRNTSSEESIIQRDIQEVKKLLKTMGEHLETTRQSKRLCKTSTIKYSPRTISRDNIYSVPESCPTGNREDLRQLNLVVFQIYSGHEYET